MWITVPYLATKCQHKHKKDGDIDVDRETIYGRRNRRGDGPQISQDEPPKRGYDSITERAVDLWSQLLDISDTEVDRGRL